MSRCTARLGLLLPLLLLPACAEPRESRQPAVAVVDVQQAFQRSPLVMVSAQQIKSTLGSAEREIKKRGRALAELRQQLEHGGLELDAEQRAAIEAQLEEQTQRLQELQRAHRAELAAARKQSGEEMMARVEAVAREVAQQQGLSLLVRSDAILYSAPDLEPEPVDITEQVARALLDKINPTEIPRNPARP